MKRSVSLVTRVPLSAYDGMNPIEAVDYELHMDRGDKLEAFVEAIANVPGHEIELTESVKIENG